MQTVVTFKGDKREIIIDFNLDEETGELNYNVNVNPPINPDDSFNLETHLADTFLGALIGPQESEDMEVEAEESEEESEEEVE
jgi:hypothetical protein